MSAAAVGASRSSSDPAPTAAASAARSSVWLTRLPRAVSPASRSSGVPSRTAAASGVSVLVTPGPWWTVATPSPCVTCAYASAAATAADSLRTHTSFPPHAVDEVLGELEVAAAEQPEGGAVAEPREGLGHLMDDLRHGQSWLAPSQMMSSTGIVSSITPYFCV